MLTVPLLPPLHVIFVLDITGAVTVAHRKALSLPMAKYCVPAVKLAGVKFEPEVKV